MKLQESDDGEQLYTYFVYDDKGNLAYVIPPNAMRKLPPAMPKVIPAGEVSQECYAYHHDQRNRVIEKHVPGAAPVFMVYDPWDRLVLSQDGNQRSSGKWTFTKYDAFNRIIMSGEMIKEGTRSQVEQNVQAFYASVGIDPHIRYEATGDFHGYTNRSYPLLAELDEVYSVNYFDDYTFVSSFPSPESYGFVAESDVSGRLEIVVGYPTGQKSRILGTAHYTHLVTYYNGDYKPVQTIRDHQNGSKGRFTRSYTFQGKLSKVLHTHNKDGAITAVLKEYLYDHGQRLTQVYHQINNEKQILLYAHRYNEIDELIEKNLYSTNDGGTFAQSVDYRYNIRGWVTSINNAALENDGDKNDDGNDFFGMELSYNEQVSGIGNIPQYNGNISAIKWKNRHFNQAQAYIYQYDGFDRFREAQYTNDTLINKQGAYDEGGFTYDANGNILSLKRYGWISRSKLLIDDLSSAFKGNQLHQVIDASGRHEGFHGSGAAGEAYSYDANGNMTKDMNKGIYVSYNHMNLANHIEKSSSEYVQYEYDANGLKRGKRVFHNGTLAKSKDYIGDYVYENGAIRYLNHDEGILVPHSTGSGWVYHYYLKDHLGSVRLTFAVQGEEEVSYVVTAESENAAEEGFFEFYESRTACPPANHTPSGDEVIEVKFDRLSYPYMKLKVVEGQTVEIEGYASYQGTGIIPDEGWWCGDATTLTGVKQARLPDRAGGAGREQPPQASISYGVVDEAGRPVHIGRKAITLAAKLDQEHLQLPPVHIKQDGTIRISLIYAESDDKSVYFDDVKAVLKKYVTTIIHADDYYPFGLRMSGNHYQYPDALEVEHLYNGKELQDEIGLDWYDYGARMYDMDIARWHAKEPNAETYYSHSPYVYALNNPLRNVDLDGRDPKDITAPVILQLHKRAAAGDAKAANILIKYELARNPELFTGPKEFVFDPAPDKPKGPGGFYNPKTNIVSIGKDKFGSAAVLQWVMWHESRHAVLNEQNKRDPNIEVHEEVVQHINHIEIYNTHIAVLQGLLETAEPWEREKIKEQIDEGKMMLKQSRGFLKNHFKEEHLAELLELIDRGEFQQARRRQQQLPTTKQRMRCIARECEAYSR